LAKTADRNYSNVHTDVSRLSDLGLIERTTEDAVFVPFDDVEVHFHLANAA
jgi:predicted transcriptional regulator